MNVGRLKRKDLKAWLPLDSDEEVRILCRHVSQAEFDVIDESTRDKKGVRDAKEFRSALANAVVEEWEGIHDDGSDFPCTKENIDYLAEESTSFRLLITGAPLSMEKMLEAEKESIRKKLLPMSGQKKITPVSIANNAEQTKEPTESSQTVNQDPDA